MHNKERVLRNVRVLHSRTTSATVGKMFGGIRKDPTHRDIDVPQRHGKRCTVAPTRCRNPDIYRCGPLRLGCPCCDQRPSAQARGKCLLEMISPASGRHGSIIPRILYLFCLRHEFSDETANKGYTHHCGLVPAGYQTFDNPRCRPGRRDRQQQLRYLPQCTLMTKWRNP